MVVRLATGAKQVEANEVGEVVDESNEGANCDTATTQREVLEGVLKSQGYPHLRQWQEASGGQDQAPELAQRRGVITEEIDASRLVTK